MLLKLSQWVEGDVLTALPLDSLDVCMSWNLPAPGDLAITEAGGECVGAGVAGRFLWEEHTGGGTFLILPSTKPFSESASGEMPSPMLSVQSVSHPVIFKVAEPSHDAVENAQPSCGRGWG